MAIMDHLITVGDNERKSQAKCSWVSYGLAVVGQAMGTYQDERVREDFLTFLCAPEELVPYESRMELPGSEFSARGVIKE